MWTTVVWASSGGGGGGEEFWGGGLGQNLKMEEPTFINLLILEHLKSYFIKP